MAPDDPTLELMPYDFGVSTEGKQTLNHIEIKIVDAYGNVINLNGQQCSFALVATEQ